MLFMYLMTVAPIISKIKFKEAQSWELKHDSGETREKSNENKHGRPLGQNKRKMVNTGRKFFFKCKDKRVSKEYMLF